MNCCGDLVTAPFWPGGSYVAALADLARPSALCVPPQPPLKPFYPGGQKGIVVTCDRHSADLLRKANSSCKRYAFGDDGQERKFAMGVSRQAWRCFTVAVGGFAPVRVAAHDEADASLEALRALLAHAVLWSPIANTRHNPVHLDVALGQNNP